MNISENKFVSLTYALTVDGQVVDQATAERPLDFIFGMGMLLPEFEKNILGKVSGDKFAFVLTPENGYGEINPEAVVELPKEIFMVDGKVQDEILTIGNVLPMGDNMGNRMMGTIRQVTDAVVTMDFNHPMAGKTLNFEGEVVGLREATEEDMAMFQAGAAGGCGGSCGEGDCGEGRGCGDDCNCGDDCDCQEGSKAEGCGCGC